MFKAQNNNKKTKIGFKFQVSDFKNRGFTLIEILIVIGIISIIIVGIIVAINPGRRFAEARNSQREADIYQLWHTVNQKYLLAGEWICAAGPLPQEIDALAPVFKHIGTGVGQYNLFVCLIPDYLDKVLIDPTMGHYVSLTDYFSGYKIWQHPVTRKISLRAPYAELEKTLAISILPGDKITAPIIRFFKGWAWSENIGWISMNSITGGGEIHYGVNILDDNTLSGFAWNRGVGGEKGGLGWIKFNVSPHTLETFPFCPLTTCPAGSPNHSARIDPITNRITGWVRFCAGTINNDCLSPSREYWNGWVLMGPIVKAGVDYGAWLDTTFYPPQLRGWAWGGPLVSWISFNCLNADACVQNDYRVIMRKKH